MSLTVRLLGSFDVQYDGKPVALPTRAAQSLFAYLVLTAGTSHRREKLAGMFWPDASEEKARTYLRQTLWRIRKELSALSEEDYLIADDMHITFDPAAAYWLDVRAIQNLREAATIDDMTAALSDYQGELLPGFYDEWVMQAREEVQAVYEQKMARLLVMLEHGKRWTETVEWAERWISLGQGPETAFRYLMTAYDALGDRAKVAATYQRCVQALRELDLEPSEETRALAVKRTRLLNIPVHLTSFVGREVEREEVARLLARSRLVTLTGSGGVGKTRLSTQVVPDVLERFPDGVWFLDLAPLSDPALLPNALASLLGLRETAEHPINVTEQLIRYFQDRTAMLIFDNCEHLVEDCAQLVHALLTACEHLSILATSREALRVSGEITYRVPSLELPKADRHLAFDELLAMEAIQLFVERARTTSLDFPINASNVFAIARICQQLDGIPLAIELAAARVNSLSVEQISSRLHDRFNLLTAGLRSALPRHQTLRAAIGWSYDLLSEHERFLFRRLAVFTGGCTLEAAETVCSGNGIETGEVLDLLSQLANKSLLVVDTILGESRYRILETIRQFASERLVDSGETGQLESKHFAYFLRKAEELEPRLTGAEQSVWMDYLGLEHENIRHALDWAISNKLGEESLRLFGALGWFWIVRCHFQEGSRWFKRVLELREGTAKHLQAKVLGHAGAILWIHEGITASRQVLTESINLYRELGDRKEIANRLCALGLVEEGAGNLTEARALYEESLRTGRAVQDRAATARALFNLAYLLVREGDYATAAGYFEESLEICRQVGDSHLTTMLLLNMGQSALQQQAFAKAHEYYQEALALSLDLKEKRATAVSLLGFSVILCARSLYARSAQLQGFADRLLNEVGAHLMNPDSVSFHQTAELLKSQMGATNYQKEYEAGGALGLEQALELAFPAALPDAQAVP